MGRWLAPDTIPTDALRCPQMFRMLDYAPPQVCPSSDFIFSTILMTASFSFRCRPVDRALYGCHPSTCRPSENSAAATASPVFPPYPPLYPLRAECFRHLRLVAGNLTESATHWTRIRLILQFTQHFAEPDGRSHSLTGKDFQSTTT